MTAPSPELTMRRYLQAVHDHHTRAASVLMNDGVHGNVVAYKAEEAWRKGYIECGVAPLYGWITEAGYRRLHLLHVEARNAAANRDGPHRWRCTWCESEWSGPKIMCPRCGDDRHVTEAFHKLVSFEDVGPMEAL